MPVPCLPEFHWWYAASTIWQSLYALVVQTEALSSSSLHSGTTAVLLRLTIVATAAEVMMGPVNCAVLDASLHAEHPPPAGAADTELCGQQALW